MFDAEVFKRLFQSEDDWKAFYKMMFDYHTERLNDHSAFENQTGELDMLFRRMADVRYEAEGEAWKKWQKTANREQYALELEQADESIRQYNTWLARKYTDRKLIHDSMEYGEFTKSVPTIGGEKKWVNDDVEAIA